MLIFDSTPTLDVANWKVRMSNQRLPLDSASLSTILYIEHTPGCLDLVTRLLRDSSDYQLISSSLGTVGLQMACDMAPDLILLDLHLPDMDGFEILKRLRFGRPTQSVPIIIVSAEAHEEEIARCLKAGANDYLVKPYDLRRLLSLISFHLLESRSSPDLPISHSHLCQIQP
jgi:putative two-component system response regulator